MPWGETRAARRRSQPGHGFLAERYVEEPRYLVALPEALAGVEMLLEPLTVVEKAIEQTPACTRRTRLPHFRAIGGVHETEGLNEPGILFHGHRGRHERGSASRRLLERGDIVVGPVTAERIRHDFVLESLGEKALKNVSEPIHLYRLIPPGMYDKVV